MYIMYISYEKEVEYTKGVSESVSRKGTSNTMAKTKKIQKKPTTIYKETEN